MLRAADSARRAAAGGEPLERVDHDHGVAAAGRDAAPLLDRLLDRLRLRVGRAGERDDGDRRELAPVAGLLRAHAGQHDQQLQAVAARECLGDRPRQLRLARPRRAADQHARALAERRQPLDGLERHVLGVERQALGRPGHRELVELGALGHLLGRAAVDRVDAHERGEALRAPRSPHGAADAVAGHELAALDLRGGDVDVVVAGLGRIEPDEGGAVAEQLDDTLDGAVAGRRRLGLLLRVGVAPLLAPAPAAPAAAPAARPRRRIVVGLLLGARRILVGGALLGLGRGTVVRRRLLTRVGRADVVGRVGRAVVARARRARCRSPSVAGLAGDDASISSGLRSRRKPSTPSSLAITWRSASGLRSSASRSRTEDMWTPRFGRMAVRPRCAQQPATSAPLRLAGVPVGSEALVRRERALAAQDRAHREVVGGRGDVVHAQQWAPASAAKPTAASVAAPRRCAGRPVIAPRKSLRESGSSSGRPSACSASRWRSTATVCAGVLAKSGPGSRMSCSAATPAARATAHRSARKSRTSATTSA